jgi:hypothetical protein
MGYGGSDGIEGHVEEVEKSESDDREERKDDTRRLGTSGWKNDMIEQGGTQSG